MTTLWDPVESSGLPDDFDFTIAKAEFGFDAGYQNGEQLLLIITSQELNDQGEPHTNFYSLGGAGLWDTHDGGRTAVSGSNPPASGFNKASSYWKFIEAALEAGAPVQDRGTPDNAAIWEGLTFHMNRVTVERPGLDDQVMLLPTCLRRRSGKS